MDNAILYLAGGLAAAEATGVTNFTGGGGQEGNEGRGGAGIPGLAGLNIELPAQADGLNASAIAQALDAQASALTQAASGGGGGTDITRVINLPTDDGNGGGTGFTPPWEGYTPPWEGNGGSGGGSGGNDGNGGNGFNVTDLSDEGTTPGDWVAAGAETASEAGQFVKENSLFVGGTAASVALAPFTGGSSLALIGAGSGASAAGEILMDNSGAVAKHGKNAIDRGVTLNEDTSLTNLTGDKDTSVVGGGLTGDSNTNIADTLRKEASNSRNPEAKTPKEEETDTNGNKPFGGLPVADNSPVDRLREATPGGPSGGLTGDPDTSVVGGGLTGDPDTNAVDKFKGVLG